jgi:hypothetical protein
MAPKQKTFELIPDLSGLGQAQQLQPIAAADAVQSRPPMTTKQAKKLYRQKTKGPKLSKAEQRRIDLMEQDRIRKEFEKEKAQARARAARDKKKAKEDKEREEKRRKGLPLVDVRPSQDTISRFISKLGAGTKNNTRLDTVHEADSESATEFESDAENAQHEPCEGQEQDHKVHQKDNRKAPGKENEDPTDNLGDAAARTPKRRKLGQQGRNLLDRMIRIPSQPSVGAIARVAQELESESWSRPSSPDTDDPANETMLEDQLIADVELASSKSAARSSPDRQSPAREPLPSRFQPPPPARPQSRPQPLNPQKSEARQLPAGTGTPLGHVPQTESLRARPAENVFKKPAAPFVPVGRQRQAMRSAEVTKSPAPKFKTPSGPVIQRSSLPKFLPKPAKAVSTPLPVPVQASPTYAGSRRPPVKPVDAFPTSTQLLVMNHVDELFPSASQEALELYEDHQPAKPAGKPCGTPSPLHNSTSLRAEHVKYTTRRLPSIAPERAMPPSRGHPVGNASPEFLFIATQDLILSSQDMAELDTPSRLRPEPASRAVHSTSHGNTLPLVPDEARMSTDQKYKVRSGAEVSCSVTTSSAGVVGCDLQFSSLFPAPSSGPGSRDTPLGQAAGEVTKCPTQGRIRPQSPRLRSSRNGTGASRPTSQPSILSLQNKGGIDDAVGQHQSNEAIEYRLPSRHAPEVSPPGGGTTAHNPLDGCAVPPASPSRKRMFGPNGLGAEVLVAMERSYRECIAEERRRKEELRAQARRATSENNAKQDLAEVSEDDLLDDEIDFGAIEAAASREIPGVVRSGGRSVAAARPRSPIGVGSHAESHAPDPGWVSESRGEPLASQETDYGEFDLEAEGELELLADIMWADDDLSDI